jgi:hypothetical protein
LLEVLKPNPFFMELAVARQPSAGARYCLIRP